MADDVPTSGVPQARIAEIRAAIHQHLRDHDVYGQIREIMSAHAADHVDFNPNSPDDVVRVLKERGMVSDILNSFGNHQVSRKVAVSRSTTASSTLVSQALKANQRHMIVRLVGGKAFLDALDGVGGTGGGSPQGDDGGDEEQFVVHIQFGDQRCRSTPKPFVCDPDFDDDFLFQFPASLRDLLECDIPLHLIVTREDKNRRRATVVGENLIDWRRVLKTGALNVAVELAGDNPGVPQGIVELQIEIVPMSATRKATDEDVLFHVERSRSSVVAADREFLLYARRWWAEYHGVRASHGTRHIKVFAQATNGRMLPVTHFVYPIQPDRIIMSPEDAARFVSLIAVDRPEDIAKEVLQGGVSRGAAGSNGAGGGEQWLSSFVFLAQRHGDAVNHATLLASLLLGFGVDAYCAMGTNAATGRASLVVLTRRKTGMRSFDAMLWIPTTGQRYAIDNTAGHGLSTLDCVFNDSVLYANIAETTDLLSASTTLSLDFDDDTKWMALNQLKLRIVPRVVPPPLLYLPMNKRETELQIEQTLRSAWSHHREKLSLSCSFNNELSFVLGQALSRYEQSRRAALSSAPPVDLSLFHQCIKGTIGEGRTFKGFPINVTHLSARKIFAAIIAHASGRDVVELNADDVGFGLRVYIEEFAEGVVSVWVMVAAKYRSLPSLSSQ